MNASRVIAIVLVIGAALWIGSGMFVDGNGKAEAENAATAQNGQGTPKSADGTTKDSKNSQDPLPSVRVMTSKAQRHDDFLRVSGQTEAVIKADIRAETSARVIEIDVEKGQRVKKGDVLVRLAAEDRPARLEKAKALVEQRELQYDAAKSLAQKNFRSKTGVAEAKANLEEARADLKIAEVELSNTVIRAPFDGIVEDRQAEIGDLISTGETIASMIQADPMLVVVHVPERSIEAIHRGQPAEVELSDGRKINGKVRFAATASDNKTHTYRVEVAVDNAENSIPDGMTAELQIPVGAKMAHHIVPSSLVLNDAGELGVRAVVDGKVAFFPVGLQGGTRQGVWVSGLPDSFDLIVVGQDWVKEGTKVSEMRVDSIPGANQNDLAEASTSAVVKGAVSDDANSTLDAQ